MSFVVVVGAVAGGDTAGHGGATGTGAGHGGVAGVGSLTIVETE